MGDDLHCSVAIWRKPSLAQVCTASMWARSVSLRVAEDAEPDDIACVARALGLIFPTGALVSPVVVRCSARLNAHWRDCLVKLEEVGHRYLYKPGSPEEEVFPISVSGLWSKYFDEFDGEAVVAAHFGSWSCNPGSKWLFAPIRGT